MKTEWKKLALAVAIPLAVGGLSALMTVDNMIMFEVVKKPPLAPPKWLFPVAWTVLYVLMGIASYLVYVSKAPSVKKNSALSVYVISLIFNFAWSLIFFNLENYLFAFVWLCALWLLVVITTVKFFGINKTAGILMLPYVLWVTFAGYLNYGIYLLN